MAKYATDAERRTARAAQKAAYGVRREERARRAGLTGYGQLRGARERAKAAGLPAPRTFSQAVQQRTLPPRVLRAAEEGRPNKGRRPQKITTAAGTVTTSTQLRVIRKAIADAQASGDLVTIRATFRDKRGIAAQHFIDGGRRSARGSGMFVGPPAMGQAPVGPVVVRTVSPSSRAAGDTGIDPRTIDPYAGRSDWGWLVRQWDEAAQ